MSSDNLSVSIQRHNIGKACSESMCKTGEERSNIAHPKLIKYDSREHCPQGLTIVEGRL